MNYKCTTCITLIVTISNTCCCQLVIIVKQSIMKDSNKDLIVGCSIIGGCQELKGTSLIICL